MRKLPTTEPTGRGCGSDTDLFIKVIRGSARINGARLDRLQAALR